MIYDVTVDYEEEEKEVVHDISVHLTPKSARRPSRTEKVKRRKRVTTRRWTGRYRKLKGGFASASYAKRYPHLVRRVYVTEIHYKLVEETRTVKGGKWTDDDAFKAFWAAHKVVQKGGTLEKDFTDWTVEAINWRKGASSYDYSAAKATEVLGAMGGILEDPNTSITVKLRVGELEGDE